MDILPDELYGLVLGFLTNQSEELLLCKGVSKKWQKIVEASFLWFSCDLLDG
jgi:hypothetical protein